MNSYCFWIIFQQLVNIRATEFRQIFFCDKSYICIAGFEDIVAIDRKSLPDFISCLTTGRERFMREMERLRGFQSAVIVVESPFSDLASGRYRSKLDSKIAVQSVISIMQNYRMPFFFAETRKEAEKFVFDFLRHFCRHALARYKAVSK